MATNHDEYDLLKNPAVDYDRTDLSPQGILVFLVGLLVAGVFVELVIWGMFHFLAQSPYFAKGNASPMAQSQKLAPSKVEGKDFENTTQRESRHFSRTAAADQRRGGHGRSAQGRAQGSLRRAALRRSERDDPHSDQ